MKPKIKKLWVATLRGGMYTQGHKVLKDGRSKRRCCLGVLCELAVQAGVCKRNGDYFDSDAIVLPESVQKWAGIKSKDPVVNIKGSAARLSLHNDGGDGSLMISRRTFAEIADAIESQL